MHTHQTLRVNMDVNVDILIHVYVHTHILIKSSPVEPSQVMYIGLQHCAEPGILYLRSTLFMQFRNRNLESYFGGCVVTILFMCVYMCSYTRLQAYISKIYTCQCMLIDLVSTPIYK